MKLIDNIKTVSKQKNAIKHAESIMPKQPKHHYVILECDPNADGIKPLAIAYKPSEKTAGYHYGDTPANGAHKVSMTRYNFKTFNLEPFKHARTQYLKNHKKVDSLILTLRIPNKITKRMMLYLPCFHFNDDESANVISILQGSFTKRVVVIALDQISQKL